jgi:hypothetical protein
MVVGSAGLLYAEWEYWAVRRMRAYVWGDLGCESVYNLIEILRCYIQLQWAQGGWEPGVDVKICFGKKA